MGVVKVTPQEKIDEYFNSDALSQSMLKKLLGGIGSFLSAKDEEKKMFYEEKGHFIIGSAVDMLLTGEEGQFEKTYHVSELVKKPSDVEMSMVNWVFNDVLKIHGDSGKEIVELAGYPGSLDAAITEHDWYKGKPGDVRIASLIERCSEYFEDLKKGIGKQILTATEDKLIKDIVFSLRSNSRTAKYFNRKVFEKKPNIVVYYQLPIYFNYREVYCKALLDLLIVELDDDNIVTSIEPIDLKTMNGSTLGFLSNLKNFRYDIQAAWYVKALLSPNSFFDFDPNIVASFLKPFKFIVESNSYPGQPLIYEIDDRILEIGQFGIKELKVNPSKLAHDYMVVRAVKGFEDLLDTYIYQTKNDWKEEEVITKNDGVLKIDWNGIKN